MYQTKYSDLVEFGSIPTMVYFVHKAVDHKEVDHTEVGYIEVDHKEVDHKEIYHTESGDHIGRMEFVKKIDDTAISKVLVALIVTVVTIFGKIPIGFSREFVVAAVSKVLARVE